MTDIADGTYGADANQSTGMIAMSPQPIVASAIPVKPPSAWFENPGLTQVTPLQISASGQVYGHVATWRQDHIGMAGKVKAPKSRSNYAFFATGVLQTAEDTMVNVGQITLSGGHASLEASVQDVVAHYDNTDSGIMDVSIGEDKHGIFVAGALRPDVDDMKIRSIRASSVSGDWRPINGNLELVAVCAVNVPGFPVPQARVAGGAPVALVAAGTGEIVDAMLAARGEHVAIDGFTAALAAFDQRVRLLEDSLVGKVTEQRATLTAAIAAAKASVVDADDNSTAAAAALRARVAGAPIVWADGLNMELTVAEGIQASLRARAKGLSASASGSWTKERRETAANRGQALPDGSFPIADKTDWHKAKSALGRAGNRAAAVRHLRKRGRTLGVPAKEYADISLAGGR
jgi:hypothetical protein